MKAIPTSVKAQFFAMYLGQETKCIRHFIAERNSIGKDGTLCMSPSILADIHERTFSADDFYLELRSVSDLTDEELVQVLKINKMVLIGHYDEAFNDAAMGKWIVSNRQFIHQDIGDYLRSIGILISFTYLNEDKKPVTLSVDELIGMKWVTVKK